MSTMRLKVVRCISSDSVASKLTFSFPVPGPWPKHKSALCHQLLASLVTDKTLKTRLFLINAGNYEKCLELRAASFLRWQGDE